MLRLTRRLLTCIVLSCWAFGSPVHAGPPAWLSSLIDSSKTETFSADATCAILLHDRRAELGNDGTVRTHVRQVVKVLKSNGKPYAVLNELINSVRTVEDLKGWLVTPSGEYRNMEKANTAVMADEASAGVYTDNSRLMAVAGDLDPGAIAAYEYTVVEKDGWTGLYQTMTFQVQEPVRRARYSIQVPSTWQLHYSLQNADSCQFSQLGSTYSWTMAGLPHRPEEPYMPPWSYLRRRLSITGGDTTSTRVPAFVGWNQAGRWYDSLFSRVVSPEEAIRQETLSKTNSLSSSVEKVDAIAAFVRDNIRYVAVELDKGGQIPREPHVTLANRYGDCKDKAALVRALLKPLGVKAIPVLASVGGSVDPDVPTPMQFNHCIIAMSPTDVGWTDTTSPALVRGWLLFDPTAEGIPLGELPLSLYGSYVLLAGAPDSQFVYLPYLSPELNTRRLRLKGKVDAQGNISATVAISAYGPVALEGKRLYRNMPRDRQIDDMRELIAGLIPGATIDSFVRDMSDDSLVTTFRIQPTKALSRTADLSFLTVNPIANERSKAMKAGKRESPIWFGAGLREDYDISWDLDSAWTIDGQYQPIEARVDSCSVQSSVTITGRHVAITGTIRRDGRVIDPSQYGAARAYRRACDNFYGYKLAVKGK